MGAQTRSIVGVMLATIVLVVAGGVAPGPAAGAIGDIMGIVNLVTQPNTTTVLCPPVSVQGIGSGITGTSVAVVRGGQLGPQFIQYKVLLVTSCLSSGTATADTTRRRTIYFVNPATGAPVTSIQTFVPPRGWSALTLRPDKADLIGCVATGASNSNLEIYRISYQQGTQGVTALLVGSTIVVSNNPLKGVLCDGLAWDPDTKTIYASADGGTAIRRWRSLNNDDSFTNDDPSVPGSPDPDLATPTQVPLGGGTPKSCLNSGLAFIDGALFVACQGLSSGTLASTGQLVNKKNGASLPGGSFSSVSSTGTVTGPLFEQTLTEDIECDSVTFQAPNGPFQTKNRDALWAKNRNDNILNAFELPSFTCGRSIGPLDSAGNPILALKPLPSPPFALNEWRGPGACPVSITDPVARDADTDGDGLLDCWEDSTPPGIDWDGDGVNDITLCVESICANRYRKDVFVEVDSFANRPFDVTARDLVVAAFANAPVSPPPGSPPGTLSGIALHVQLDDGNVPGSDVITDTPFITLEPCTPAADPSNVNEVNIDQVKKAYFGTKAERQKPVPQNGYAVFAKRMAFRYAVFAQNLKPPATNPGARGSGCAKLGGDDLVVTLGSIFAGTLVPPGPPNTTLPPVVNGSVNDQAGTFMHELGHTLGLRHGGGDSVNCKPNYLSVMSYSRQFSEGAPLTGRRLDYSRGALPAPIGVLNEAALDEGLGLVPTPGVTDQVVFAVPDATGLGRLVSIKPAGSNIDWDGDGNIEASSQNDVNNFDFVDSKVSGCTASAQPEQLAGYNDWANLQYNHRASLEVAGGEVKDPVDGLPEAFANVDLNGDGRPDGTCPTTGQPWDIDIQSPVNLGKRPGVIQVTILSQPGCIVANLDPQTVFLSGSGGKFPLAVNPQGTFQVSTPDINHDGLPDWNGHFSDQAFLPHDVKGVLEGTIAPNAQNLKGIGVRGQSGVEVH